jgi:hypothetical protein
MNAAPASQFKLGALSVLIGGVCVPLYTALSFFVVRLLPDPIKGFVEMIHYFGPAFFSPPSMDPWYLILGSSSFLGALFGLIWQRRFALSAYSIVVHSWRLTVLSWLATAVFAALLIGYMVLMGIG